MKKIILIITLLLAFISCIKSNEVKNDAKDISSISKSNLKNMQEKDKREIIIK